VERKFNSSLPSLPRLATTPRLLNRSLLLWRRKMMKATRAKKTTLKRPLSQRPRQRLPESLPQNQQQLLLRKKTKMKAMRAMKGMTKKKRFLQPLLLRQPTNLSQLLQFPRLKPPRPKMPNPQLPLLPLLLLLLLVLCKLVRKKMTMMKAMKGMREMRETKKMTFRCIWVLARNDREMTYLPNSPRKLKV